MCYRQTLICCSCLNTCNWQHFVLAQTLISLSLLKHFNCLIDKHLQMATLISLFLLKCVGVLLKCVEVKVCPCSIVLKACPCSIVLKACPCSGGNTFLGLSLLDCLEGMPLHKNFLSWRQTLGMLALAMLVFAKNFFSLFVLARPGSIPRIRYPCVAWNARRGGSIELPHCVMVELACSTNTLHVLATLWDRYKGSSCKGSLAV